MKNLSMRAALTVALGIFVLIILALGLYARAQIHGAAASITQIDQIAVKKQLALEQTFTYMMRARLGSAVSEFARTESQNAEADKLINIIRGHEKNALRSVETFDSIRMADAEGQQLSDTLSRSLRAYMDMYVTTVIAASAAADSPAVRKLHLDTTAGTLALNEALERFMAYNSPRTQALVTEAASDATRAEYTLTVAVLIALLLAAGTYLVLMRSLVRPLQSVSLQLEQVAAGNLAIAIEPGGKNEVGRLREALGTMRTGLVQLIGQVRLGVDEIHVGAREVAAGSTDLSGRSEQQAAALEETVASIEELASTVKQNAENARQANQLAGAAAQDAQQGSAAVDQVVATMRNISSSSQRIGEIVGVIDGIAFQTNILALNAAVEAARAGEQGKGFAVVASEVRALAQRSASAAKEIKELITTSITSVQAGSHQAESAGESIQQLVESARRVATIVGEITVASGEQSDGIAQVNMALSQIDQVTQQNAALVEQSAAAAGSMQTQADTLQQRIGAFRLQADAAPARHASPMMRLGQAGAA